MAYRRLPEWRTIAIGGGVTIAALVVGSLLFAASGLYNVAASSGHFTVTRWMLEFGMRRSVATYSIGVAVPALDDPDMVRLGAGHFEGGCAHCHGSPEKFSNPIVRNMLPSPPNLSEDVTTWSPEELFWIVKHGLKYTGMPAWPARRRDDEIWAVVAFLRQLPGMDAASYRRLAIGDRDRREQSARELALHGGGATALTACIRCHDDEAAPPASRLVPKLAGQSARYIETALRDYANGTRPSGIMQPAASELEADDVRRLADYYANLPRARGQTSYSADAPGQIARGRQIAASGVPESGVPPCLACHVRGNPEIFPRLAGQYAEYTAGQLRLWKKGLRDGTARGAIMAAIARRLNDRQIDDVARYFEGMPPSASGAAQ